MSTPASAGAASPGQGPARPGPARRALSAIGLLIGLGLAVIALGQGGADGLAEIGRIAPGWLALALASLIAGTLMGTWAWWTLVRAVGGPIPFVAGIAVAHLSQLGKYIPGMVFVPIAQAELGRRHGVKPREIVAAFSVSLVLAVASALLIGVGGLAVSATDVAREYIWLLALLAPLPLVLSGRVLGSAIRFGLRLVRRPADVRVSGGQLRRALVIQLVATVVGGLHVWLLAIALGADAAESLIPAVAGMSLAWSIGFLVIFVPAGIGVREGVLILALAPVMDQTEAVAIAIVSRVLFTAADLLLAGAAFALWRRSDPDAS